MTQYSPAGLRRHVHYCLVIGCVSMCHTQTWSSATTQLLKRKLRCRSEREKAYRAAETAEQRELKAWTSAAGMHACKMGTACWMCSVSACRHQNKEWPGYSRLERGSECERTPRCYWNSKLRHRAEHKIHTCSNKGWFISLLRDKIYGLAECPHQLLVLSIKLF